MKRINGGLVALALLCSVVGAQTKVISQDAGKKVDNPLYRHWAQYKPGTYSTMQTTSEAAGQKTQMSMTTKLVEVTTDKVVVEMRMEMVVAGRKIKQPPQKQEFAAKVSVLVNGQNKTDADVKRGKETLTIDGREVACEWVETNVEQHGMKTWTKSWTSQDVPGMTVKTLTKTAGPAKTTSEMKLVKFQITK